MFFRVANPEIIDLTLRRRTRLQRSQIEGPGYLVERVVTTHPVDYDFVVKTGRHYLASHDLLFADGSMRVEGEKARRGRDLRDTLTFFPAGISAEGWCKPVPQPQAFTALYIEPNAVPEMLQDRACWHRPAIYFQSPVLLRVFAHLQEVIESDPPFKDLLIESLVQVTVATFAGVAAAGVPSLRSDRTLQPFEVRRLDAYLREHLAQDIHLDDMAAVLNMSKFHFIRCFRATTGRTPYRSLLDLRCEIAVVELKAGRSKAEAAAAAGFEGTAQMSRALRLTLGIRPQDIH